MRGPAGLPFVRPGAARLGISAGLVMGLLWIAEICFNNFVPPTISTADARFVVDNSVWAAVSVGTVALSARAGYHTRRVTEGVSVGFWSGLVSGALACALALLLATIWVSVVAQDPLMIAEYAERVAASGDISLLTYAQHETLAGAFGHLILLGIGAGTLLGAIGGALGSRLPAGARTRR